MMKEGKELKKSESLMTNNNNNGANKKVMSSNLPLLFANGRPRSLETISQAELEDFVPFMILCSLGEELHKTPKLINKCPVPEWWPQGFPFKFPLMELKDWANRLVMLKSLVCRCYTYYGCEFLLKFSSDLAEMNPSNLKYQDNKGEETTTICNAAGCMLVKCRNENLYYDLHKNRRRYLSPTHAPAQSHKMKKRKSSVEVYEEVAAKKKRLFDDFPSEQPEPSVINQEQFLDKVQLIPHGKKTTTTLTKVDRKKRLAHYFTVLSVSSERGRKLVENTRQNLNTEERLERIERYCGTEETSLVENNQVCTRASVVQSARFKDEANNVPAEEDVEESSVWCHHYKWPRRSYNPNFLHRGPALRPCSVTLRALSEETIHFWSKSRRTIGTMTPDGWRGSKMQICACQKIPLIIIEDCDTDFKFKNKSSSTRCTCIRSSKQQVSLLAQAKKIPSDMKTDYANNREAGSLFKVRYGSHFEGVSRRNGGVNFLGSSSVRSVNHSSSYGKEGVSVISYNALHQSESPLKYKRSLHRKPLAVVPPTPIVISKESPDVLCKPIVYITQPTNPISATKINFQRSILDAIKWYTKDDTVLKPFVKEEMMFGVDRSQENIKPLSKLTLIDFKKSIDFFQNSEHSSERDYCFKRSSDRSTKLVTRRGERHYVDREPCPSCFQGQANLCVYEFVRQAKLAGITLHQNHKLLQLIFFKFIEAVNSSLN